MWLSIVETSDIGDRFVANVVVGTLKHEVWRNIPVGV
jgi:hypothetical protein